MASAEAHSIDQTSQWRAAIDELYESVGREQRLAQALGAFRPLFDAMAVSFFTAPDVHRPATSRTGTVGFSDQFLLEYHTHFNAHDEWAQAAMRRGNFGVGAVYRGSELVPWSELEKSYFGQRFVTRWGVSDLVAVIVEHGHADGVTSWLSFFRQRGQRPFALGHARAMAALAPHMRQVLRLHRRLAPRLAVGSTLREVAQRLDTPLALVGRDGGIVECNPAARAELSRPDGWWRQREGQLLVAENGLWRRLADCLPAAQDGGSLTLDLIGADKRAATLDVFSIQGAAADAIASHAAVAICTLRAGARDRMQALRSAFGLSAAEARIAEQLARGRSVADIAAAANLSLSTVRAQLAAVRGKMGVTRQSQIVAAVLAM